MKLFRDERGQTLVVTGLAITCLLGMAGFSVDVGLMFRAKRMLQAAADAGAIAGAAEVQYNDITTAADNATAQNGLTNGSNGVTVTVNNPPKSGSNTSNSAAVEVIVSQNVPTFFMKVFGLNTMKVSARAVAGMVAASGCIYALDPSGIDVGMNGNGALNMPDCGVIINSQSTNALSMVGNTSLTALSIGIVGSFQTNGGETPTPITGIAPETNPLSFLQAPSYTAANCNAAVSTNSSRELGPATSGGTVCYNGISAGSHAVITLDPGTYVVTGAVSLAGQASITGSGVTIYLAPPNGSLSLVGGGTLNITAPTSGTYNGIAIFQDPSDTNGMSVTGNSGSTLEGIIYAPTASLSFNGTSGATIYADLVVGSLSMSGTPNLQNYSDINKSEPLVAPRLVE